ncbi:MAG: squalene--hopene cyclase, partial [Pseudomonadota bacterium]
VGTPDVEREPSIATYLKRRQNDDGSWPLFYSGAGDISCSVKAYWALSLIGEDVESAFMVKARQFILAKGGAARANVFTRITLALFGEIPWRGVPTMPVELMLLPRWFPFHMSKVSYWSRTVIAPLLVLAALKPKAVNPTGRTVRELFVTPPEEERVYNTNPTGSFVGGVFLQLDKVLRVVDRRAPQGLRQKAIDRAMAFIRARLNGDDGLGAIYPAMANVCMAYHALGVPEDDPERMMADGAIHRLITVRGDETYLQPCFSPVWDTVLAAHALMDTNTERERVKAALDWLCEKEILTTRGDWIVRRPDAPTGGWAFQYQNDHYPDVDDTAVIVAALHRFDPERYRPSIARGADWLLAMQSRSGGWGAFEPENEHFYLNSIPFADHGALLDPPTVDVTARCVSALAQLDDPRYHEAVQKGVAFILREQEVDGSWFGRWGANYVYGTWSALCGLNAAGVEPNRPEVQKAVAWLKAAQRDDGGWGEGLETYEAGRRGYALSSTPSQTAWAVLGLMAAGAVDDEATSRGIAHLRATPTEGARFQEEYYTGTGFPRVFYLKYHGYSAYFPLWALGRYEGLMRSNARQVAWGL